MGAIISEPQAAYLLMLLLAVALAYTGNLAAADTTAPTTSRAFELLLIFDILAIGLVTTYYILKLGRDMLAVFSNRRI